MKYVIGLLLICSLSSCTKILQGKTVICRDPKTVTFFGEEYVAVKDCYVTEKN